MPRLVFSTALGAGATARPLDGWQYEYLPYPAQCKVIARSTLATDRATITSGSETIQEESPLPAGGVLGVTPTDFNTPAVMWNGAYNDRLKILLRNTGAASNVDGYIDIQPL
ncbi:MAG: hypothetical protein ACRDV9_15015 [Acidimicrobiia bacterium]